mgnify:CR=1 FL=1
MNIEDLANLSRPIGPEGTKLYDMEELRKQLLL